jgi:hypothetical protein
MLLFLPDIKKCPVSITPYFFTLRPFKSRTPIVLCNITGSNSQGASPPPPFLYAKKGRHHLNKEFTPLLPHGLGLARDIAKPYQI